MTIAPLFERDDFMAYNQYERSITGFAATMSWVAFAIMEGIGMIIGSLIANKAEEKLARAQEEAARERETALREAVAREREARITAEAQLKVTTAEAQAATAKARAAAAEAQNGDMFRELLQQMMADREERAEDRKLMWVVIGKTDTAFSGESTSS